MTAPTEPEPRPLDDDALEAEARWSERDRVEAHAFWAAFGTPLVLRLLMAEG